MDIFDQCYELELAYKATLTEDGKAILERTKDIADTLMANGIIGDPVTAKALAYLSASTAEVHSLPPIDVDPAYLQFMRDLQNAVSKVFTETDTETL